MRNKVRDDKELASRSDRRNVFCPFRPSAIIRILTCEALTAHEADRPRASFVRCEMNDPILSWRGIRVALTAAALTVQAIAPSPTDGAQNQKSAEPSPAVRVAVRMVLVDAVVTDSAGKVIPGLGVRDFTVLEDGN